MLSQISEKEFFHRFAKAPHPFLSKEYLKLNANKVEKVFYLIENSNKPKLGLVAGLKDNILLSPFSAPFGGFYYKSENIYIKIIHDFLNSLSEFALENNIKQICITLPPDIYQRSINPKIIYALDLSGFETDYADVTHWINLKSKNKHLQSDRSRFFRQAKSNNLTAELLSDPKEQKEAFEVIRENRKSNNRPIYMNFEDVEKMQNLWPVDFWGVRNTNKQIVASAITYQFPKQIIYAVFWGDSADGRTVRAMDFLIQSMIKNYHKDGFDILDIGISTKQGEANTGLMRFKDTLGAFSGIRYSYTKYFNSVQ